MVFAEEFDIDSLFPNSEDLIDRWEITEHIDDTLSNSMKNFHYRDYKEKDIFPRDVFLAIIEFKSTSFAETSYDNYFNNLIPYFEEIQVNIPFETCFGFVYSINDLKFLTELVCIKENYLISIKTETQTTNESEELAKYFLLLTLDNFPDSSTQKTEQLQKVEEDIHSLEEQTSEQKLSKGGGCLIATAIYGSELEPQVQQLRELRDNKLLQTKSGTSFMKTFNDFYYSFSPYIADYERENPLFKEMVKIAITPMISSLSILSYVDMDSEVEVLGYGISLILLNVGIYVLAPMIVIIRIRR